MLNSTSISLVVDYIGSNPLLTISSFIVAILSVAVTIIVYLKSKKEKSPCYNMISYNIIKDFVNIFDELEIHYAGKKVKNLTVTKIVFWNAGKETINKTDIVEADPITILAKDDHKILDQKIIAVNNNTNNFSLIESEDKSKVNVVFEYADKNDGAVIQIIHTGESNKNIEVCGRIKGAGKLKLTDLKVMPKYTDLIASLTMLLFVLAIGIYIMIYVLQSESLRIYSLISIIAFIIYLITIVYLDDLSKLPKGLELYREDFYKTK